MSISGKERLRNWRKKQANIGKKQVAVNLSVESYLKLNRYKEDTGHSFSTIVDTIVSSNEMYSGDAKSNDIPRNNSMGQINTKKRKSGLKRMDQVMDVSLAIFAEKGFHAISSRRSALPGGRSIFISGANTIWFPKSLINI